MEGFLFLRTGKKYFKIDLDTVLYIHAEKRYSSFVTEKEIFPVLASIGSIEKILPPTLFCRVHRSYIISLKHTKEFDNELAYIGNRKIPIAEQYRDILKSSVTIIQGLKGPVRINNGDVDKLLDDLNSQIRSSFEQ